MQILIIAFWFILLLLIWTYFGYYLILKILSVFQSREIVEKSYLTDVSLIITAYNEEDNIERKIENSLALDYPRDKLEIIVVSDGSTDDTVNIIKSYEGRGVKLIALPERHGKHYGQGRGIKSAASEIIVLSDAGTFLEVDAIEKIVRNFADPQVGCVSGLDEIRDANSAVQGEGAYVRYEMKLRTLESVVNSLVGVSGCFFAVRKHLCKEWIDSMSSDFYLPIMAYMNGYRTVLDSEAVGYYEVLSESKDEFPRKVRTVVHGLEVLSRFREILNPFRYGLFAVQMISHKLSRWLVPFYLILLFWANLMIADQSGLYVFTLALQISFYALALVGYYFDDLKKIPLFKIPLFFVMVNCSIVVAWHNYFIGNKFILWEPTKR